MTTEPRADRVIEVSEQHYDFYRNLVDMGLHDMRNASVTLHFNPDGKLAKVRVDKVVFHYRK